MTHTEIFRAVKAQVYRPPVELAQEELTGRSPSMWLIAWAAKLEQNGGEVGLSVADREDARCEIWRLYLIQALGGGD